MSTHIANSNVAPDRATDMAAYHAGMVEWRGRQERAKAYWKAHPYRPLGEPKWPVPPTRSYSKAYYEGGYRMVIDGVPIRLAAHVKDWSPRARAVLGKGTAGHKEQQELGRQAIALGLSTPVVTAHDIQLYESRERQDVAA